MKEKFKAYNILGFIMFYFIIIVVITSVLGGYLYYSFHKTVYSDFVAGNKQYLSAIVSQHENDMQIVDDIVTQIGLLDDVTRFRLDENPEYVNELKKYLRGFTTVNQFFDVLFYGYHEDTFIYHHFSSFNMTYFGGSWWAFDQTTKEEFKRLLMEETMHQRILPEQGTTGAWINNYVTDNRHVVIFRAIPPYLQDTLVFLVPGNYYDKLLADETADKRVDFLCFGDQVIVSRGSVFISQEELHAMMSKEQLTENVAEGDSVQKEISIAKENYLLSVHGGKSGVCYGTLQSMEIYHDKMRSDQWIILILVMVCVLFAVTIILFGSKGFVRKVKRLNELLNEDSYYDLGRVENGIQTLVTTFQESEKEHLILKRTRFIRNFIRGDFCDREEAITEAAKVKLSIDCEKYLVVLLRNREINNENRAYMAMLDSIGREEQLEGYGVHLVNNNQNLFVLFGNDDELVEKVLREMVEIEKQYSQDYVIAVSDYHVSFAEGSKAYLEAVTAFDNYLLMDNSKMIRFSEVAKREYVSLLPDSYLQRLKHAIRTGDKKAVETTVKDICGKLNQENASLYAFRVFYNDIIRILLSEWKGDRVQFDNFYNVFVLSQCQNIKAFGDLLCEVCNVIIDGSVGKELKVSDVVGEAIDYMQKHFQEVDLTMNALAEYLKISSVTLSVEFKNEMDIRPSDYLSNLRMEKAKELLRISNMRIREISLAVGYEDDRVFLRRFKKYTGMTPGEYRAQ